MGVDTAWFSEMIKRSPYGSQRRFARKLRSRQGRPLDPAALSLMLRGKRAIQLSEAKQFSDLLDVPLIEVLRRAGVAAPDEGARTVPVRGYVDKNHEVHLQNARDPERVVAPTELPHDAIAVRCRTARSDDDIIDGWLLFADPPAAPTEDVIGRLCLVGPEGAPATVAFVLRGYRARTYNLVPWRQKDVEPQENVALEWAARVHWVRPA